MLTKPLSAFLLASTTGCMAVSEKEPAGSTAAIEIVSRQETSFNAAPAPHPVDRGMSFAVAAPLLGNGDLGVCITGAPETQTFWVTKNDFWRLKNGTASPLNFGTLRITAPALAKASCAARQTLIDAKTIATFSDNESTVTQTSFVAATANVLVVTLTCTGKPVELEAAFQPNTYGATAETRLTGEDGGVRFATRTLTQEADVPVAAAVAWRLVGAAAPKFTLAEGKPVVLLLAMSTNFDGKDDPKSMAIGLAKSADPVALEAAHKAWWCNFYRQSFVEIPDADIMRRYYASQYIMASASRNLGFPPAIIGPWATNQSGWCGYWMNYNHAAPFYGLYSSNHIEQADPQDTPILQFMPTGTRYCRDILNHRGVLYSVGIAPFGLDACGLGQVNQTDNRFEKGVTTWGQRSNAAYNLVNMGQRWYTTYDKEYGRKIYPFAKAVAEFWEDYLVLENGRYVINGESVHEGSGKNKNPVSSLGLVRNSFKLVLDLSQELDLDADCRTKWTDILARLSPYPTQPWGAKKWPVFILSEQGPVMWGGNTVHIQHIYPASQIGLDSEPEQLATARNTIDLIQRWHDNNGANSFFPAAVRVGYDPQAVLRELHKYSTGGMAPNGFSRGNPHGIENCSTVPNTVNEMLMQSHEGVIRLFPCWPKDLDARFGTLRARGAFLVSAELKGGIISGVKILSEKGRDSTVMNPWPGRTVRIVRNGKDAEAAAGDRFTLKTAPGETLELRSE